MVPNGWEVKKIGAIANLINGRGFKASEWEKHGLPIIRIQNLNGAANSTTTVESTRIK
jgi:type I restriction enzyme S subunit